MFGMCALLPDVGTSAKHGGSKPISSEDVSDSDTESLPETLSFAKHHKTHQEPVLSKFSAKQHNADR
jgi:hypothetical protein